MRPSESKLNSDVVAEFYDALLDLETPEKWKIESLTEIASQQLASGYLYETVHAIEQRIAAAQSKHKLPVWYLLDSIVKQVSEAGGVWGWSRNCLGWWAVINCGAALFLLREGGPKALRLHLTDGAAAFNRVIRVPWGSHRQCSFVGQGAFDAADLLMVVLEGLAQRRGAMGRGNTGTIVGT